MKRVQGDQVYDLCQQEITSSPMFSAITHHMEEQRSYALLEFEELAPACKIHHVRKNIRSKVKMFHTVSFSGTVDYRHILMHLTSTQFLY